MGFKSILQAGAALSLFAVVSCVTEEVTQSDEDTPPFIDPVTLSQSMCSGKNSQPLSVKAPGENAATFNYDVPFRVPSEVIDHFHYPISTASREAQLWFDNGVAHMHNFNHDEAIASFRKAQASDPGCAMCYWGEGLSFSSNINYPYDPNRGAAGLIAAQAAMERVEGVADREAALITALATRYTATETNAVVENTADYADAMDAVARQFPADKVILALAAEANMDTQPWNYWQADGREPFGRTARTLEMIETALNNDPNFAPAIHLYIHIKESSVDPYGAEAYADRLAALDLGVGHLVHMPSHIYLRLGAWKKSQVANVEAIAADEAYMAASENADIYGSIYYPHNVHFVVASSQYAGDAKTATEMAEKVAQVANLDPEGFNPFGEHIAASKLFTDLLFGTDEAVLEMAEPAAGHLYMRTAWHYARGTVFARQGNSADAMAELAALRALSDADNVSEYVDSVGVPMPGSMEVAGLTLEGRILASQNDLDGAIARLESASAAESALPYFEPTWWYYPTRQTLGMLLLMDQQYDRAEREFFKTLIKAPNNAYALYGLSEAYRLQGDERSATYAKSLFEEAWMGAQGETPKLDEL
jgi:tetratricopeptide (TPR) repeat protein